MKLIFDTGCRGSNVLLVGPHCSCFPDVFEGEKLTHAGGAELTVLASRSPFFLYSTHSSSHIRDNCLVARTNKSTCSAQLVLSREFLDQHAVSNQFTDKVGTFTSHNGDLFDENSIFVSHCRCTESASQTDLTTAELHPILHMLSLEQANQEKPDDLGELDKPASPGIDGETFSSKANGKLQLLIKRCGAFTREKPTVEREVVLEVHPNIVPFRRMPAELNKVRQRQAREECNKLISVGEFKRGNSPYVTPGFFIVKASGDLRPVANYKHLNKFFVRQSYSAAPINDLLNAAAGDIFFSILDLKRGFGNLPLAQTSSVPGISSQELCAVSYVKGEVLVPLRMTQGIAVAPGIFQRFLEDLVAGVFPDDRLTEGCAKYVCVADLVMENIYTADLRNWVAIYIDDMLIHTQSEELHLIILEELFRRTTKAGFCLSPTQMQIRSEICTLSRLSAYRRFICTLPRKPRQN